MMRLVRTGRRALQLEVDRSGAMALSDAARCILASPSQQVTLEAQLGPALRRGPVGAPRESALVLGSGDGSMSRVDRTAPAVWMLETDELHVLLERVEAYVSSGAFFPAEFTQVRVQGRRDLDRVYFAALTPTD